MVPVQNPAQGRTRACPALVLARRLRRQIPIRANHIMEVREEQAKATQAVAAGQRHKRANAKEETGQRLW